MMTDFGTRGRRLLRQAGAIAGVRRAAIGWLVAAASLAAAAPAGAMPSVVLPAIGHAAIFTNVLTTCDTRGCFTFGPRQSYQRPNYRPIGPTGPGVASPRAARPPRFIFRPQPPRPLPQARSPAANPSLHRQNCLSRYRSYDPLTDSYIGSGGKSVRCVLPARR